MKLKLGEAYWAAVDAEGQIYQDYDGLGISEDKDKIEHLIFQHANNLIVAHRRTYFLRRIRIVSVD